jgi:hypothetical protein
VSASSPVPSPRVELPGLAEALVVPATASREGPGTVRAAARRPWPDIEHIARCPDGTTHNLRILQHKHYVLLVWSVVLVAEVHEWFVALDTETAEAVGSAVDLLEQDGPGLGRPTVDSIKGSSVHNLKELRAGTVRVLFVFDPVRNAVLLVGGDKRGDWQGWYRVNIPIAEARYRKWLSGEYAEEVQ